MAIGTAAAILGGAALSAGASAYSSSRASSAASKAAAQNAAILQEQYNQTRSDLQPYTQYGYSAGNALANRLGLTSGGATPAGGGSPSYSQYLAANPDLAAEGARVTANGQFANIGDYLQWHDANYAGEGRQSFADPTNAGGTPEGYAPPGEDMSWQAMERPEYGSAPTAPTFGSAPTFYMDPNPTQRYKDELADSTKSINARSGATQGYFAGGRAKALQSNTDKLWAADEARRFQQAMQSYSAARNAYDQDRASALGQYGIALGQYNTDRSVGNQLFDSDRGFGAGRYDTNTNNLFNLLGIGANATQALAGYGQNNANALAANNNARAGAQGNAAINMGNSIGNALGQAAGMYGIYGGGGGYGAKPAGGSALTAEMPSLPTYRWTNAGLGF